MVGYGTKEGEDYWLIKNPWSLNWKLMSMEEYFDLIKREGKPSYSKGII